MARLTILEFPDPRLRTRATPVTVFDAALGQLPQLASSSSVRPSLSLSVALVELLLLAVAAAATGATLGLIFGALSCASASD